MAKYDPGVVFSADRKQTVIDNLVKRVIEAEDELIKHEVIANTVVLSSGKYGFLMNPGYYQSICGLKVEFDNLPDEIDFVIKKRQQTNSDVLRAMSDEELADWFHNRYWFSPWCSGKECPPGSMDSLDVCRKCVLDWLQQAEEGE